MFWELPAFPQAYREGYGVELSSNFPSDREKSRAGITDNINYVD